VEFMDEAFSNRHADKVDTGRHFAGELTLATQRPKSGEDEMVFRRLHQHRHARVGLGGHTSDTENRK
jgi:hypothetical protein